MSISTAAIVLVAGRGCRLRPLTNDLPKCLIDVGGRSILDRLLCQLADCGVMQATVVGGYLLPQVEKALDDAPLQTLLVANPHYDTTGSAASLLIGLRSHPRRHPALLVEGDMLFEDALLASLLRSEAPVATLYDPDSRVQGSRLQVDEVGRVLSWRHRDDFADLVAAKGKALNLTLVGDIDAREALVQLLEEVVEADPAAQAERALDRLCGELPVLAVEAGGGSWVEVDDEDDLSQARLLFDCGASI